MSEMQNIKRVVPHSLSLTASPYASLEIFFPNPINAVINTSARVYHSFTF